MSSDTAAQASDEECPECGGTRWHPQENGAVRCHRCGEQYDTPLLLNITGKIHRIEELEARHARLREAAQAVVDHSGVLARVLDDLTRHEVRALRGVILDLADLLAKEADRVGDIGRMTETNQHTREADREQ